MTNTILTQDELKKALHYCPETGILTWLVTKNQSAVKGKTAGNQTKYESGKSYIRITVNGKRYQAHRLAVPYMTGSFPDNGTGHDAVVARKAAEKKYGFHINHGTCREL